MFTGLVEKISQLDSINQTSEGAKITFRADFDDIKKGSSVSVNGVCLTITNILGNTLTADVMPETLRLTNLKNLKKGDIINLERAMGANSRFDGHIVSGHIDTTATLKSVHNEGFSVVMEFSCNTDLMVKKGSVAINGISLTVVDVKRDSFSVSLIPETIQNTNLKTLKKGDIVNIEFDIFAKYIKKFTNQKKEITMGFLETNGFN